MSERYLKKIKILERELVVEVILEKVIAYRGHFL
jgi:hypothetical protein